MFPTNPYVLSKAGRLCLETGRRREARKYFDAVKGMIKEEPSPKAAKSDDITDILGAIEKSQSLDEQTKMLHVLSYFNNGFLAIFDGNFQDAIAKFREVQNYKPANIIAANNIATCQM